MRFTAESPGPQTTEIVKSGDLTNEGVPAGEAAEVEPSITDSIIGITNFAKSIIDMLQTIDGVIGDLLPAYRFDKGKKAATKHRLIESKEESPAESAEQAAPAGIPEENAGGINTLLDKVIAGEGDITLSELRAKIADGSIYKYVAESTSE